MIVVIIVALMVIALSAWVSYTYYKMTQELEEAWEEAEQLEIELEQIRMQEASQHKKPLRMYRIG